MTKLLAPMAVTTVHASAGRRRASKVLIALTALLALTSACVPLSPTPVSPTPTSPTVESPTPVSPTPESPPSDTPTPPAAGFEAKVNTELVPQQAVIEDAQGNLLPVATSRDDQDVQSDFVEGVVLVRPDSAADLQTFLDRYEGVIIDDDTIPEPPPELGITLTDEERRPTEYVVRVNLAAVDTSALPENAAAAGLEGVIEFSTEAGVQTFAAILDAKAAGFDAAGNWIVQQSQIPSIPGAFGAFFNTRERANAAPAGGFKDGFAEPRYGSAGSQSNVTLAWQYVAAHGFQRRVWVAIIDSGFYLDNNGVPIGNDSDFLPGAGGVRPVQYDFTAEDAFAGGPGPGGCGAGNPCYWHGTGSTGVAAGVLDNARGEAGVGGLVANQMLFRFSGARDQRNQAIRTAVAWQADVVSMSFGGDCNRSCRIDDRDDNPFDDAVDSGRGVVFVTSAGNGRVPAGSPPNTPAQGYPVGSPNFVHACIEDRTICVGALNDNAVTKTGYSNFGDQVGIFAPTNIPVMSYPPSVGVDGAGNAFPLPINQAFGVAVPQSFGGTSASAPFVAGVAAMMKAINPTLNHDAVARILRETARPGVAPVTRTIDALAAVRRAAEGIPNLEDRHEPNNLESTPTNLGAVAPYSVPSMSINARDRDYFRFDSPGGSRMTINLQYPAGLSTITPFSLHSLGGGCAAPVLVGDAALAGNSGHAYTYRAPGGPFLLGLRSDEVNAYNLTISFANAAFAADGYEVNDTPAAAKRLYTWKSAGAGILDALQLDARFSIEANIHRAADVDFYIVRGSRMSLAEQVLLQGSPALSLFGNDSPISLQVFELQAGGAPGNRIANLNSASCMKEPLTVRLAPDAYYLVQVSGSTGAYSLENGIVGNRRQMPILVRDRMYEVLHPGEPVEKVLNFDRYYVLAGDDAYRSVRTPDPGVRLSLFDLEGSLIAESAAGEPLSLAETQVNQVYALLAAPEPGLAEPPTLALEWEAAEPRQTSENLIVNPGAEIVVGETDIPGWQASEGFSAPRLFFYDDGEDNPSPTGPGPQERGFHLFAGGADGELSGMQQTIDLAPSWIEASQDGRVKFSFGAFLGGKRLEEDYASASLTFLNGEGQALGRIDLPTITPREREGETGLFPVALNDYIPAGTRAIVVELTFHGFEGGFNDGYADNLELVLSEYAP